MAVLVRMCSPILSSFLFSASAVPFVLTYISLRRCSNITCFENSKISASKEKVLVCCPETASEPWSWKRW